MLRITSIPVSPLSIKQLRKKLEQHVTAAQNRAQEDLNSEEISCEVLAMIQAIPY